MAGPYVTGVDGGSEGPQAGVFSGLTPKHGPAHLFRAIIEGVCCGTELIFAAMRESGAEILPTDEATFAFASRGRDRQNRRRKNTAQGVLGMEATLETPPGYKPHDDKSLPDYLADVADVAAVLGGDAADWRVREVGDGNLNLVFIVEGPDAGVAVKQALPYVRLVGKTVALSEAK